MGSCLTEMNCPRRHIFWQSKKLYWEGIPRWRILGVGSPGELLHHMAHSLGFYVNGLISGLSLVNHPDSGSFLVAHTLFSQNGCQWGFWEILGHTASPFDPPEFFWWFFSSAFLTRTPCCKITHTNGYYGAWPGWVVSVSVFLLTKREIKTIE